ncbi:MAG: PD-(D/E)XK nuclease family protein [Planctomycetes bacterium]|nr:PD-(D/E)XK nuclease family protein [Planctomycetota bacterium]
MDAPAGKAQAPPRIVAALAGFCRERLLEEKWLLAPSRRVGAQWLDQVARAGQPAVNVRLKTLRSLAIELAALDLARSGLTLLPDRAAGLLLGAVFAERRERLEYLSRIEPGPRAAESLYRSVRALRFAGLDPERLEAGSFEVGEKGKELAALLEEYARRLRSKRWADPADVLRIAAERLHRDGGALPQGALLLVPAGLAARGLEKALVEAVPPRSRVELPVDEPAPQAGAAWTPETDLDLLRWIRAPAEAPPPAQDGTVRIERAVGEANEVRAVLRRLLARRIPFDAVEVLHTDSAAYVPLVYEALAAVLPESPSPDTELPVTFAEGIPCRYSRPGRALGAWVDWARGGCPGHTLVKMLREGLLEASADGAEAASGDLAVALAGLGFLSGQESYLPRIDDLAAALERSAGGEGAPGPDPEEESDEEEARRERDSSSLAQVRSLRGLVAALLRTVPRPGAPPGEVLDGAGELLEKLARSAGKLDAFARERLLEEVSSMRAWLELAGAAFDAWEWLAALPGETSVLGSGPQPGCLHVAPILTGGHSGRPWTFAVGLDDGRFPGAGSQDPLLLDSERRKISPDLPTVSDRTRSEAQELARLLSRLRGNAVFSFSCRDLAQDREMFPSPVLLSIHRIVSGKRDDDLSGLLASLPPPASFVPSGPEESLDESEWWLWRLTGSEQVTNRAEVLAARFQHLERGRQAAADRRERTDFTPHDGRVEVAGTDLDPTAKGAPAVSASQLEMVGKCPLRFFFRHALCVRRPEDLEADPDRWLDPLQTGELLHLVFESLVRELIDAGEVPHAGRHMGRILEILAEHVRTFRAAQPPPTESAFRRQARELERAARTFLVEEAAYCESMKARPVYAEASLGLRRGVHRTAIDSPDPMPFALAGGAVIRVRGRVDRIDRIGDEGDEVYAVWDYKTGRVRGYELADPFRQGRVVQPVIYASIVQHRLREVVSKKSKVKLFGFFFPGARARGERLRWSAEDLAPGAEIVRLLCDVVKNGAFLPTTDAQECAYCDYRAACGDVEALAAASVRKLEAGGEAALRPLVELKGI